jgi:hypothetical protein
MKDVGLSKTDSSLLHQVHSNEMKVLLLTGVEG